MTPEPRLLVIDHLAKDQTPHGFTTGGTVAYAALTAVRKGFTAAVVTSAGPDLDPEAEMPGVRVHVVPSSESTVFVNDYSPDGRIQTVKGVAAPTSRGSYKARWSWPRCRGGSGRGTSGGGSAR